MTNEDVQIEVSLVPNKCCGQYHYVVTAWTDQPCYQNGRDGTSIIMPGTENGCWYNTGINGYETSPEAAFAKGLKRYTETK